LTRDVSRSAGPVWRSVGSRRHDGGAAHLGPGIEPSSFGGFACTATRCRLARRIAGLEGEMGMNTMLRTYGSMVLTVLTLLLASCSRSQGPPTVGELKEFGAVCDKGNDGKRVAVEGYLRFPESFTGRQSAVLRLYRSADFTGTPIGVQMPIGGQANQMEMPPK